MPYASDAQRRFFHTNTARAKGITPATVSEFDQASKGMKLPARTGKSPARKAAESLYGVGVRAKAVRSQKKAMSKSKTAAPRTVNLGAKGSFKINHPGVERARAQAAGMSTSAYAQKHKGDAGVIGRQSRSAIGLMAMGKK